MLVRFASNGGVVAAALLGVAASPGAAPSGAFDTTFTPAGEPAFLHATVLFGGADGPVHRMDLWRDHERRVLRTTDGRITTLATRTAGAGYDLVLLDHPRHTSTRISRDNLYRIGTLTDWFDLGHGLRHPRGAYRLAPTTIQVPATLPAAPAPCRWIDLVQEGRVAHICWDERNRLPLLIVNARWAPAWRVLAIDNGPIPATRFALNERGYIRNDANRDVNGD